MNFLLIISSILTVVVAQQTSISCTYRLTGVRYYCELRIINPNGSNDFTQIGGTHLQGFTNADVDYVIRSGGSVSTNVPSIICDTFSNVTWFDFYGAGLTEVADSYFAGCSRITRLFLDHNRISSISPRAFINLPDLTNLYFGSNFLATLPENVFANQRNLTTLTMDNNPFDDIPVGLFQTLENLQYLDLSNTNLTAINNQWFTSNTRFDQLLLSGNRIVLSADSLIGLESLILLNLANNALNKIPVGTFARLSNLRTLDLSRNNFTEFHEDTFPDLGQLTYLDISSNTINVIHDGAFRRLGNLTTLDLSFLRIRQLRSNIFDGLENLANIALDYNEIEEIPQGFFVPLPNLIYIGLWNNRLKTLNRNSFGSLTNLQILDLEGNVVNALDRAIFDDAVNLNIFYFERNLCASSFFINFQLNRNQFLAILERCFINFRYNIETITEGDDAFSLFEAPNFGIALRVNTDSEVQIALTPFNFTWNPMIEFFIGTTNNTRSTIRINQETNVVTVPTPNIITRNQWNDFRVTWVDQVVLVFSGNDTFPFMGFTMQDFFPVNFYGLRAVNTRASWTVQPFQ